jgi:predicted TIM-barrel fold metal-dependent hydrolase
MSIIDAHAHVYGDHPPVLQIMDELDVKVLNICVAHKPGEPWRQRRGDGYRDQAARLPQRFAWCTTFDLPGFDDPYYAERVIAGIEKDYADGAVGVKVWKSVGMDLKDRAGEFVMVDDPIFEPIFAYLERTDRTLLMHIGEPMACWRPLRPGYPHFTYYSQNPQWHMYGKHGPSHAQIITARDRVIERHPKLRIVGAHLGSVEYDLREMARRLDRFRNFAMDTAGRLDDLKVLPTEPLREFFQRYQDRMLFATDNGVPPAKEMSPEQRQSLYAGYRNTYEREFEFFETDRMVPIFDRQTQGLGLSEQLLEKFYTTNARRWYPGV